MKITVGNLDIIIKMDEPKDDTNLIEELKEIFGE